MKPTNSIKMSIHWFPLLFFYKSIFISRRHVFLFMQIFISNNACQNISIHHCKYLPGKKRISFFWVLVKSGTWASYQNMEIRINIHFCKLKFSAMFKKGNCCQWWDTNSKTRLYITFYFCTKLFSYISILNGGKRNHCTLCRWQFCFCHNLSFHYLPKMSFLRFTIKDLFHIRKHYCKRVSTNDK